MKQDNRSGYVAMRDGAGIVNRSASSGRILLTGADRRSYLQGLLTNDIEALGPGTGCYAAMLTAQGRMMTDMRVLELGDSVLLDVPAQVTRAIRDHLERFVFTEDVTVEDVSASRGVASVIGPKALDVLVAAGTEGRIPSALFDSTRVHISRADVVLVRSDAAGIPGFDIFASDGDMPRVESSLVGAGALHATEEDVEIVRIESGRPRFGADMDEETIPLEAGLEDRAISRTKGCYVGQEVIVRVIDRGHGRVARRLVGFTLPAAATVPSPGSRVVAGGKEVGRVTSSTFSPVLARPIALGYIHRDFVEPGTAVSIESSGDDAVVASLPFVPLEHRD